MYFIIIIILLPLLFSLCVEISLLVATSVGLGMKFKEITRIDIT